jgi:hypothetical protein
MFVVVSVSPDPVTPESVEIKTEKREINGPPTSLFRIEEMMVPADVDISEIGF